MWFLCTPQLLLWKACRMCIDCEWTIKYMTRVFSEHKKRRGDWIYSMCWLRVHQLPTQNRLYHRMFCAQDLSNHRKSKFLHKASESGFYLACGEEMHEGKWVKGFLLIEINFGPGTASCRTMKHSSGKIFSTKGRDIKHLPSCDWVKKGGSGGPILSIGVLITACRPMLLTCASLAKRA